MGRMGVASGEEGVVMEGGASGSLQWHASDSAISLC